MMSEFPNCASARGVFSDARRYEAAAHDDLGSLRSWEREVTAAESSGGFWQCGRRARVRVVSASMCRSANATGQCMSLREGQKS